MSVSWLKREPEELVNQGIKRDWSKPSII